jgi:hypothetical protein
MGAPNNAMMQSPMNLSTVPLHSKITALIDVKNSFSIHTTSRASIFSDMVVKPRISA